jgi:quercetin dioxygenase-like cupin family protein
MFDWVTMREGVRRRVLADGQNVMAVLVELAAGAEVPTHEHIHEQITTVVSGTLEFTLAGETHLLKAGQAICVPSQKPHMARALEATTVIDAFSPPREDFRK